MECHIEEDKLPRLEKDIAEAIKGYQEATKGQLHLNTMNAATYPKGCCDVLLHCPNQAVLRPLVLHPYTFAT